MFSTASFKRGSTDAIPDPIAHPQPCMYVSATVGSKNMLKHCLRDQAGNL